jgi:AraC-like DNA-binding protein
MGWRCRRHPQGPVATGPYQGRCRALLIQSGAQRVRCNHRGGAGCHSLVGILADILTRRSRAAAPAVPLRLVHGEARAPHAAGFVLRHRLGGYREYEAPQALSRWVEAVWTYRAPADDGAMHRILPDPAVSIAYCYTRDPNGIPRAPKLMVFGPKLEPVMSGYKPGAEIAAVKLKVEWAAPMLGIVATDHLGAAHDLSDVHPAFARRLLEVLAESPSVERALDSLATGVEQATRPHAHQKSVGAARAFDLVRGAGGRLRVERVASMTGVSLRQLRREARRDSGIPLKLYARLLRLVNAVTAVDRLPEGAPIEWARVAVGAGYYDQPHLIRECRAITGMSPSELVRERRREVDVGD